MRQITEPVGEGRQLVAAEHNDDANATHTTRGTATRRRGRRRHALQVQFGQLRQIGERVGERRQLVVAEHDDDVHATHTTRDKGTRRRGRRRHALQVQRGQLRQIADQVGERRQLVATIPARAKRAKRAISSTIAIRATRKRDMVTYAPGRRRCILQVQLSDVVEQEKVSWNLSQATQAKQSNDYPETCLKKRSTPPVNLGELVGPRQNLAFIRYVFKPSILNLRRSLAKTVYRTRSGNCKRTRGSTPS